jgi:4-diphosphocytidyl-2-C-methyl-D-erythritol kinase
VNNRTALATGVGDQIEEIDLDLSQYRIVVVKPPFGVSTREAYAIVKPYAPEFSLREIVKQPVSEWKRLLKNDFEPPIVDKYPLIGVVKQKLYDMGAIYASMSGSGSSIYAIFERNVPVRPNFGDCFVWIEE